MLWLIDTVGSLLIAALSVQAQPFPNHYTSPKECGFEFDYPSDWVIVSTDDQTSCSVRLRPRDFVDRMKERDVDVYTIDVGSETIEVKDYLTMPKTGLLNEKAPNDVFFARVNALKVSADQPLTVNPF